jgi:IS30 family transposase
LSEEERIRIADMASRGDGPAVIGRAMGRAPSTISRELRRNRHPTGQYRPFHAQRQAAVRRRRPKALKLTLNPELHAFVSNRLRSRWSPQQISRALRAAHPVEPELRLSTKSIYLAIYRPDNGLRAKPDPLLLRTGRDHGKAQTRQVRSRRRFAQPMHSVHDRGFEPTGRPVAGHWEGDLIVGPNHRSGIGTLVERQTRFVKLVHLPVQDSTTLRAALVAALARIPAGLRRTLTWDQGTEMA